MQGGAKRESGKSKKSFPRGRKMSKTTERPLQTLEEVCIKRDQNMRGTLAERSLLAANGMCGKDVEIVLHQCGSGTAKLMAMQSGFEHYIVTDVQLPSRALPSAVIRMSDTVAIGIDFDKLGQPAFSKSSSSSKEGSNES
ncbi:hypothetical protein QR680_018776 [Steinernema hermaphroditum]|uniref:Uncharacterized protein n=1 Tax=Steinernema hermaphroditum TaxID=289476 RepID=A0AA39LRL4_9BILA|nr:hypothetical protein QR680_018776 [Steinernema hermaphroditum]